MAFDTSIPLALYKANLEFALRVGALLQENQKRWLALGASSAESVVDEARRKADGAGGAADWNALASLPGEAFWQTLQQNVGNYQALLDTAVGNQTDFSYGLRDAFAAWRKQCTEALHESSGALPLAAGFDEVLKQFSSMALAASEAPKTAPTPRKGRS